MITVFIAATLRSFTEHNPEFELEGESVGDILKALTDKYPETEKALFDQEKKLRFFVNVYVNDTGMNVLDGLQTKVNSGDEILLLPVIAGGASSESIISDERRKEVTLTIRRLTGMESIFCFGK